jgi:hypothetical protein
MPAAAAYVRRPRAPPFVGFARHRPENTLLFSSSSSTIQHSARCVPWQVARGKGKKPQAEEGAEPRATPRPVEMNWARRLKRVFGGRHRVLRALRREACDHCQHRGAGDHCEDSGAPGVHGSGSISSGVAARGTSAAGAGQPALNSEAGGHFCWWLTRPAGLLRAPGFRSGAGKGGLGGAGRILRVQLVAWRASVAV